MGEFDLAIGAPDPAAENWAEIDTKDHRNLEEKIRAVSPHFPQKKLYRLARRCALARVEAETFAREYVSLRRRILDICQEKLEDLVVPAEGLLPDGVDLLIDELVLLSFERLQHLSKSYDYKISDIETTRGVVLSLFDDCFIAFDQNGT